VLFVLITGLISYCGFITISPAEIGSVATFLCNTTLVNCGYHYGHLWSLCIEEQFYILWPLAFVFVIGGRRTANARHQTLSGMLDWSYRILSETERAVLCRLAIFPGEFTLPAACSIAANSVIASSTIVENLASLVAKSLVIADFSEEIVRYRLLGTTRIYAFGKLAARA